jgi:hypothetical protein
MKFGVCGIFFQQMSFIELLWIFKKIAKWEKFTKNKTDDWILFLLM